jgi:acyl carrier protein
MDLNTFTDDFAVLFEETDPKVFKAGTKFRDIEEWSSMAALIVIGMADEKYNVSLTGDDIRKAVTVEDLFLIIKEKQKNG